MRQLIRCYGAFQFFFGLLLWLPIFYEYQARMGLSATEIFAIQSLYQIAFCLVEVPTGYLADRFGYRLSLRLGAAILIAANLLPIFAIDYAGFLTHFVLIALARSFISGASSAYLYEALQQRGQAAQYKQIEGSMRAYSLIGRVVSWGGVGFLMNWHLTSPYWLTAFFSCLSLVFAFLLPAIESAAANADNKRVTAQTSASSTAVLGAFSALASRPVLLTVMLQGVAIFVLSRIAQVTLFQPILSAKSLPLTTHGLVMSAMTVFEAIGSARPQWARNLLPRSARSSEWTHDFHIVTLLTVMLTLPLTAIPWLGSPWTTIVALCLHSLAVGWSFPIQRQLMNDTIPDSRYRATLLSLESIIDRGISALVTLLLARSMAAGGMDSFLLSAGIATVLAMFLVSVAASHTTGSFPNQ